MCARQLKFPPVKNAFLSPPFVMSLFALILNECCSQSLHTDAHLHTSHHLPFRFMVLFPFLKLTVTRSENTVNKSLVVSFLTTSSSGISPRCCSSRSLSG